jgi:hypothetical protein
VVGLLYLKQSPECREYAIRRDGTLYYGPKVFDVATIRELRARVVDAEEREKSFAESVLRATLAWRRQLDGARSSTSSSSALMRVVDRWQAAVHELSMATTEMTLLLDGAAVEGWRLSDE